MPAQGSDVDLTLCRPDLDQIASPPPNTQDLCAYCLWPMQGDKILFNGAYGHARCVAEHERLILGDDAGPGLLEHLDWLEERAAFLDRLGYEAAELGMDTDMLALAVARANHHA
jgi:hypothetical protein